ncbi:hypothetical protein PRK78_006485 [Emydomyces testavorans]|uniref:Uncharacterized protein n=1 Tax=Emydomyces testavorans TaxID=2070801 RepID=A0AAF0DP87_9EURO|nr:hypothetical protein PRK78_006485 [Emydomyces testavorans]
MTSASSDRPASSLSESWATLSNSDAHSEDDWRSEHTDNISLIGVSVADDVTSLDGRDLESDVNSEDTESHCSESRAFLPPIYREADGNFENEHITQASFVSTSESIVFEEPDDWPSTEVVELKRTIEVHDNTEASQIGFPFDLGDGNLTVSLQQSIVQQPINVDQPFRVLFIGNPVFKSTILDKLGDVLVASPRNSLYAGSANSSRFHVVPASFGPDATPNYAELLPIHVQLIVDECVSATDLTETEDGICLSLKEQQTVTSTRTEFGFQLISASSWVNPDITIFFIGDDDDFPLRATRHFAFAFMARHKIPSMFISETALWNRPSSLIPLDPRTLHICLESCDPNTGVSKVVGRYPVDLNTFENISPAQLNRNLASVTRIHGKAQVEPNSPAQKADSVQKGSDIELYGISPPCHPFSKREPDSRPIESQILGIIITVILISLCCTGLGTIIFAMAKVFAGFASVSLSIARRNMSAGTNTTFIPSTSTNMVETSLLLKPNAVALSDCTKEKSLSTNNDILKFSSPAAQKPNNTDRFQVYVVGDCHVIIKVPSRLSSRRKSVKFEVKVTKAKLQLDFHVSKLFDKVYILRLAREDAHGVMNVTISVKTKPLVEQITEVDFGTPWLKIANWKRAAQSLSYQVREDLNAAQTGLTEAFHRVSLDLQLMSDALKREAGFPRRDLIRHMFETANEVMRKSKRISELVKRDTVKRIMASSRTLQKQAQSVNKEATALVNELWAKMQLHAERIRQSAKPMDLTQFRRTVERAKKSQSLASAQKQAFQLKQDARRRWRESKFPCNGKTCSIKGGKQR